MNVLVVGAGKHQIPGILKLKEKGHYVVSVDGNPNAAGRDLSDEFYFVDIVKPQAVIDLINDRKIKVDTAMCFSVEIALRTVATINDAYGLKGLSMNEVLVATDKAAQRKILKESNLPTPKFIEIKKGYLESELARVQFPVVVKPTDNAGSRGVCVVRSEKELIHIIDESLTQSKFDSKVVVEEFVPGLEFTVEALIIGGRVNILGISEKKKPVNNYTISIELFYNSPFVEEKRTEIESVIVPFLTNCGFNNTITHTEVIYSYRDHKFYVVETTVRSGGFHIFDKILPVITGIDIIGITIDTLLGEKPKIPSFVPKSAILGFFYNNQGKIENIHIMKDLIPQDGCEYDLFVKKDDVVADLNTDGARLGYFVTFGKDWQEVYTKARIIEYAVKFEII